MFIAIRNYVFENDDIFCTCHCYGTDSHLAAIQVAAALNAMNRQEARRERDRERLSHPACRMMPLNLESLISD